MQQWFTAQELADMNLPGLPSTKRGVLHRAKKEGWSERKNKLGKPLFRARKGQGGGWEYHKTVLDAGLLIELHARLAKTAEPEQLNNTNFQPAVTTEKALERDAKLYILHLVEQYKKANPTLPRDVAISDFCLKYGLRKIIAEDWVYGKIKKVSPRSIYRWLSLKKDGQSHKLAGSKRQRPSILDMAEEGKIAKYIGGLITAQPAIKAKQIRMLVKADFSLNPLPSIAAFQRFIRKWKIENRAVLESIQNPDRFKSKYRLAGQNMNSHVVRLNQLWEIDASPADVLTKDGRLNLYAIIDIYSRRMLVLVSKTPRTEASLALVRRAIIEWGVPEVIRTDNGSDFISNQFKRAMISLDIEQDITPPFSPEKKATVERAIKTLQHGMMHLLPGFVGHNVAERKAIEERKAFAARLGESPDNAFCVDITMAELQRFIDRWVADIYTHQKHRGIKATPFEKAATWTQPVRRIENERALDLLLSPLTGSDGFRQVTKHGIRYDTAYFYHHELVAGHRVFCRTDPADMGRLYVYDEDEQFLCVAQCPERLGIDPAQAMAEAKKKQAAHVRIKREELKKEARKFKPRDMIEKLTAEGEREASSLVSFPQPANDHTTPELEQAENALGENDAITERLYGSSDKEDTIEKSTKSENNIVELPETSKQRFTRALLIELSMEEGSDVPAEDAKWLGGYQLSAEYRAEREMYEEWGEDYIELENK